ncbi:unnamed protein product [Menidia menidia]|uniref:(Atlantic silverside) hypothetical protein n=1 Tax=Menidia menidia TaxID=238744 RepID=A0A8S4BDG8_9TELE|nr:unnamed protein product [Menidia menidia]
MILLFPEPEDDGSVTEQGRWRFPPPLFPLEISKLNNKTELEVTHCGLKKFEVFMTLGRSLLCKAMSATLLFSWLSLVLCLLAPPSASFSHGAGHAACLDMIPGHIRAHSLDPQHSYVSIRTSTLSYYPGQLITVTVRSSRDFMGFLLQARSVGNRKHRARRGFGVRSVALGPLLAGGSWILTPSGTRTLHCLSEGDTVTHSDKQRKRYLSFVWRAPDTAAGDLRFHITVVQSYFVYWAGIESTVVRDGSRRSWRGSNTTAVDELSTIQSVQEEKVTVLPGSLENETHTTPAFFSVVSEGIAIDPVPPTKEPLSFTSTVSSTDIRRMVATTTVFPNIAVKNSTNNHSLLNSLFPSIPPNDGEVEGREVEEKSQEPQLNSNPEKRNTTTASVTTIPMISNSFHVTNTLRSTDHNPKGSAREPKTPAKFKTQSNLGEPQWTILYESQVHTTKAKIGPHLKKYSSKPPNLPAFTSKAPLHSHSNSSQNSHLPSKVSFPMLQNPSTNPILWDSSSNTEPFRASTLSQDNIQSDNTVRQPKSRTSGGKSTTEKTHSHQTTVSSPLQPHTRSIIRQPSTGSTTTQTLPSFSQFDTAIQVSSTSPQSLYFDTLSQSPVTPQSSPLSSQSMSYPVFTLEEDLQSPAEINATSLVFGFASSVSPKPSFSSSKKPDSSSLSMNSFQTSDVVHPSTATHLHQSAGSTLESMFPVLRSTLPIHSTYPSSKKQPKTAPAFSALPSPFPVSTPHLSTTQSSLTSPLPFFLTSSTVLSSNYSNYSSPTQLSSGLKSDSSPFSFNSSLCLRSSNIFCSSSSTVSLALSSPATSISLAFSPTLPPPSFSSTSTSTAPTFTEHSTFPFISSITSPNSGPSPSLHRSLHTPLASLVPSKNITSVQTHIRPSNPDPDLNVPTQTVVHPNPKPYPNLRVNYGQEFKSKIPNIDIKPKHPSDLPKIEGKYPDIIPRHSTWELGILLGCSAALGMVLMVGVRYMYRQACGRRTEVTLNDREREYGRGERGLIHVQECGDLVRVRKIRENSFVLLTEYDVLASPGN